MIARLYEKGRSTITEHLKKIFLDGELDEDSVCRKSRRTGADGKEYNTKFYDLLNNSGKVTVEVAKIFAESEFEKYRIVQDRLFESDFDRLLKETEKGGEGRE